MRKRKSLRRRSFTQLKRRKRPSLLEQDFEQTRDFSYIKISFLGIALTLLNGINFLMFLKFKNITVTQIIAVLSIFALLCILTFFVQDVILYGASIYRVAIIVLFVIILFFNILSLHKISYISITPPLQEENIPSGFFYL